MRSIPHVLEFPRGRARRAPLARALGRFALLASILFAALVALPRPALAGGTVRLTPTDPIEVDGRWKLNMTIDYGSMPAIPHVPMIFTFQPTVLYERALTDKSPEKPTLNRIPLQNQQTINESMDVGFADATGKVFKVTKFDFVIRRDHGFEAGEYELKIKREDDGVQVGQTIRLTLKGDNPVVDRRAIVFAGDKPKKKEEKKADAADEKKDAPADEKKDAPADEKKDEAAPNAGDGPPPVPPKQGGCGCLVAGDAGPSGAGALAGLALAAAIALRRRRR